MVYSLAYPAERRYPDADLGYEYHLPQVKCPRCGVWGLWSVEYPAFQFDFLNKREFRLERVVSLDEFDKIRQRFAEVCGRPVNLIPGGSIGRPIGRCTTARLNDFVWGRVCFPQVSKRARDLLRNGGVSITTAECDIRCRGRKINSHLAIHLEPLRLLDEEGLDRHGLTFCDVCGGYNVRTDRPENPAPWRVKRSVWPEGVHLALSEETSEILASPEFIRAVKHYKLTGLRFVEFGVRV